MRMDGNLVCLNARRKQQWFHTVVMRDSYANQHKPSETMRIRCRLTHFRCPKHKDAPFVFAERAKNIPKMYDVFENVSNVEWPICRWFNTLKRQHTVVRTMVPKLHSVSKCTKRTIDAVYVTIDTMTGMRSSYIEDVDRRVRRKLP